jgi:hypothetical protein
MQNLDPVALDVRGVHQQARYRRQHGGDAG